MLLHSTTKLSKLRSVAPSSKKFKATLHLPEVSPNTPIESKLQFKKAIPVSLDNVVKLIADSLKSLLHEKMKIFELEFKCL